MVARWKQGFGRRAGQLVAWRICEHGWQAFWALRGGAGKSWTENLDLDQGD